jgi:hypothetical protein
MARKPATSRDDVTDSAVDLLDAMDAAFNSELDGLGTAETQAAFAAASAKLRDLVTAEIVSRINHGRGYR